MKQYGGRSVRGGSARRRTGELGTVVLERYRDGSELFLVRVPVVGAEKKLTTGGHRHADVGLGAATVTTVGGGQGRVRGKC